MHFISPVKTPLHPILSPDPKPGAEDWYILHINDFLAVTLFHPHQLRALWCHAPWLDPHIRPVLESPWWHPEAPGCLCRLACVSVVQEQFSPAKQKHILSSTVKIGTCLLNCLFSYRPATLRFCMMDSKSNVHWVPPRRRSEPLEMKPVPDNQSTHVLFPLPASDLTRTEDENSLAQHWFHLSSLNSLIVAAHKWIFFS